MIKMSEKDRPTKKQAKRLPKNNLEPWYTQRTRHRQSAAKMKHEGRAKARQFREQGCWWCGEEDHAVIHAHHLDPQRKTFNIYKGDTHTTKELEQELAKCIPLCLNCHRKTHMGRIPSVFAEGS